MRPLEANISPEKVPVEPVISPEKLPLVAFIEPSSYTIKLLLALKTWFNWPSDVSIFPSGRS